MKFVYIIIMVFHSHAGASRVGLMAPGEWETKQECVVAAQEIREHSDNRKTGLLNVRCVAVPAQE